MKTHHKINVTLIVLALLFVVIGCSSGGGSDQNAEVNKLVDQANKKMEETKELFSKTETRNSALFSANVQTVQQLRNYQARMNAEARAIVADYEKVSENLKDVAKQYDDISRMNVDEKYKEYAKLKSDEFAKRSEAVNVRKGNAQAFAEISDPRIMNEKFNDNNSRSDRLLKDAEDIASKAKKVEEDNKDLFRQS